MGAKSDPIYLAGEKITDREHNLTAMRLLPKKNRDKVVSTFKNATLFLKDIEFWAYRSFSLVMLKVETQQHCVIGAVH
jgi:hypothetical protein